jgi:glycosyltransferase involved in cell wall biosynthesis
MYHGNLAASLARARVPHARVVWSIRQTLYHMAHERPLTRMVIRAGARWSGRPEVIIYNSAVAMEQHRAHGYHPRRDTVIPNGFDCDQFRPRPEARDALRSRLRLATGTPLIGLVARYHPMKDHATFLRMAGRLVASGSEAHFICAGQGVDPGNPELAAGITAEALAGRVHLLGEEDDVSVLLAGLDLLCSSSRRGEGFSNVLGEAMACGVPCVVTDVGDGGMIVGATGLVVAPGDATALAEGCARLLAEPPTERARRAAAARARIVGEFSIGAVAARYAEVFRGVLEASPIHSR